VLPAVQCHCKYPLSARVAPEYQRSRPSTGDEELRKPLKQSLGVKEPSAAQPVMLTVFPIESWYRITKPPDVKAGRPVKSACDPVEETQ